MVSKVIQNLANGVEFGEKEVSYASLTDYCFPALSMMIT
jgi:hypothetical protein